MNDAFKIYVEQLRDGHTETINEVFTSDSLGVQEADLQFTGNVVVKGQAYLASGNLVLHMDLGAQALIPCSICNKLVEVKVEVPGFYHTVPLEEVKSGIYYFQELLREEILLATPGFAECAGGSCPQRKEVGKFLKTKSAGPDTTEDDGYRPFAGLDLNKLKPKS